MNFFRLRVLNTFLLFLIGIVAGFILKDRFYPAAPRPDPAAYKAAAPQEPPAAADTEPAEEEEPAPEEEEEEPPQRTERPPAPSVSAKPLDEPARDNGENHIVIEPVTAPPAKKAEVLRVPREEFFRKPSEFAGRELEMDLQIITAKRTSEGWRLNFVYTAADKRIDYLYADATAELLGDKPDLRIGYIYKVRFFCGKGDPAAGNTLSSSVSATGEKADWATGLSAVE